MRCKIYSSLTAKFLYGFALVFSFLLIFTSCEEPSFIGLEVLPEDDGFNIHKYEDIEIETSTRERDSILGRDYPRSLLGSMDDPVFGGFKASFMTQLGISVVDHDFGPDPIAEELVLYLHLTDLYGQEGVPQKVSVYQLNELIDRERHAYSNFDPMTMSPEPGLVTEHIIDMEEGDSIVAIPIVSQDLQDKLLFAPDSAKQSISQFITYFNGLYVTAEMTNDERGSVHTVNLNSDESRLSLYYKNTDEPDSILQYNYIITENANRINLFEHDYSKARFADVLGQTGTEDSLLYIQGGHGLTGRLDFDHLNAWRDSMSIAPFSLNSASLYLPVNMDHITDEYPLPDKLLALQMDEEGELVMIDDFRIGENYFGGDFNSETGEYKINITNWVNSYIKKRHESNSIHLAVMNAGFYPNLVMIRNRNHTEGGIRLEIMYTRF